MPEATITQPQELTKNDDGVASPLALQLQLDEVIRPVAF